MEGSSAFAGYAHCMRSEIQQTLCRLKREGRGGVSVAEGIGALRKLVELLEDVLGSMSAAPSHEPDVDFLLDSLGLDRAADATAIRRAHRQLAKALHPDHAGSTERMQEINVAKDTLLRYLDKHGALEGVPSPSLG